MSENTRGAVPHSPIKAAADVGLADRLPLAAWLLIGIVLIALTQNRWNIALLGWLAPVPWLIAAERLRGWRAGLLLLGCATLALTLQTLKIISAPMPYSMAVAIGVPVGLITGLMCLAWAAMQRRLGPIWGIYVYVALATLMDWLSVVVSPTGAWGVSANSQLENLPLLQLASLGGLSLIGALMAWVAAGLAAVLTQGGRGLRAAWAHLAAALLCLLLALGWGAWRLDRLDMGPTLAVAGVVGQRPSSDQPAPASRAERARLRQEDMFARSALAAQRGAKLLVWSEGAVQVEPAQEEALRGRAADFARRHGVELLMAYVVITQTAPLRLDNKFEWFGPDGAGLLVYRKHKPAPGEPALVGEGPMPVLQRPWGKAAGAICYDYDFPSLAREQARAGAGLVLLPSGDWRGIDPYHTLMARLRAIEGGMALLRPVEGGSSMLFDALGRQRAAIGAQGDSEGILLAQAPTQQVPTFYTRWGDWPLLPAAAGLLLSLGVVLRRRKR